MKEQDSLKPRLYFTASVAIAIWFLLAWNYYHGGIPSHHLLADENLPEISNVWGALLLPVLTWILLYRIKVRINKTNDKGSTSSHIPLEILFGFVGALLFGIILSAFFVFGNTDIPGYMLMGLLPLALFVPIYRSEYILGFVIGMTYTFGAVLSTIVGCILALTGAVIYFGIRPVVFYLRSKLAAILTSNKLKADI